MQMSDLRPAKDFASAFGVKMVVYGGPGSAKTPVCVTTAPNAVVLMTEPGFLSVRTSLVPTFPAFTSAKVDDFMMWFLTSNESKNYETLVWDSVSQAHEQKIKEETEGKSQAGAEAHGMRAYGKANRWMIDHLFKLYFAPGKNVVLVAKLQNFEINEAIYRRPYFAGKELPVRVPHLFDEILALGNFPVPGVTPSPTRAFLCKERFDYMARDRSGNLAEYEPPDLTKLIAKCKL